MKRARSMDKQGIGLVKEQEVGEPGSGRCPRHAAKDASSNRCKSRLRGMDIPETDRLKMLEDENTKLRRLFSDAMLDNAALKDLLSTNW
ncbi:hypothetical protein [Oryzifoliimicrobium ureilyticus]|uniref:hypothetical protein n=1 Tax=Oryzifoliimicrobium ureilyticus TaxID=3113724 RepID=UPI003076438B